LPPPEVPPLPPAANPPGTLPPDSAVVANDSVPAPPSDTTAPEGRRFGFPAGELSLIAEAGLYNSVAPAGIEINPLSCNAGLGARYTIHPWSRHQLAGEIGFFQSTFSIAQNQPKAAPLFREVVKHERITQWKLRIMIADRLVITRNEEARFDAVEIGMFCDLGVLSTHVAIHSDWNDEQAAYTRNKSRRAGLRYMETMQYGITARIVSGKWSVIANYRLSNMLKAGSHTGDLPKLLLGAAFAFGG
jgi:hypothetical protein